MADQKISTLAEDTSPAADDLLVTVDVSDTSMAASGTDKRVQLGNLLANVYYAVTLTTASGGVTLTTASSRYQLVNPNGANRDVNLPSVGSPEAGLLFAVKNTATSGAFYLVVKNSGGTQQGNNVPFGATLVVICDGSGWQVL